MYILEEFLKSYPNLASLVYIFLGFLLGSGSIWKYLKYKNEDKANEINTVKSISDLRKEQLDKLILLIEKSEQYTDIRDGKVQVEKSPNKLNQLNTQINLLRDDIESIEYRLSALENRKPLVINLQYIAPPMPLWRRNNDEP